MPYLMTSLISIWNDETETRKKNILFKMKQTILLEFDPKDAKSHVPKVDVVWKWNFRIVFN